MNTRIFKIVLTVLILATTISFSSNLFAADKMTDEEFEAYMATVNAGWEKVATTPAAADDKAAEPTPAAGDKDDDSGLLDDLFGFAQENYDAAVEAVSGFFGGGESSTSDDETGDGNAAGLLNDSAGVADSEQADNEEDDSIYVDPDATYPSDNPGENSGIAMDMDDEYGGGCGGPSIGYLDTRSTDVDGFGDSWEIIYFCKDNCYADDALCRERCEAALSQCGSFDSDVNNYDETESLETKMQALVDADKRQFDGLFEEICAHYSLVLNAKIATQNNKFIGQACKLSDFAGVDDTATLQKAIEVMQGNVTDENKVSYVKQQFTYYKDYSLGTFCTNTDDGPSYTTHVRYNITRESTWASDLLCSNGGYIYRDVGWFLCRIDEDPNKANETMMNEKYRMDDKDTYDYYDEYKKVKGALVFEDGHCRERIDVKVGYDGESKKLADLKASPAFKKIDPAISSSLIYSQKIRASKADPLEHEDIDGDPNFVWEYVRDPFHSAEGADSFKDAHGWTWYVKINKTLVVDKMSTLNTPIIIPKSLRKNGDHRYKLIIKGAETVGSADVKDPKQYIVKSPTFVPKFSNHSIPFIVSAIHSDRAKADMSSSVSEIKVSNLAFSGFSEDVISGTGRFQIFDNMFTTGEARDGYVLGVHSDDKIINNKFYIKDVGQIPVVGTLPSGVPFLSETVFRAIIFNNKFVGVQNTPIYIGKGNKKILDDMTVMQNEAENVFQILDAEEGLQKVAFDKAYSSVGYDGLLFSKPSEEIAFVEIYKGGKPLYNACNQTFVSRLHFYGMDKPAPYGIDPKTQCNYEIWTKKGDSLIRLIRGDKKGSLSAGTYTAVFHGDWGLIGRPAAISTFIFDGKYTTASEEAITGAPPSVVVAGKYEDDMTAWYDKVVKALGYDTNVVTIKDHCKNYIHPGVADTDDKMKICFIREGCAYLKYSDYASFSDTCTNTDHYTPDVVAAALVFQYGHPKTVSDLFFEKTNWSNAYYVCVGECKKAGVESKCEGNVEENAGGIKGKYFYDDLPVSVKTCMLSNECVLWDEGVRTTKPVVRRTYGQKGIVDMESECKIDGTAVLDYFKTNSNANMWGVVSTAYKAKPQGYTESPAVGGVVTPPEDPSVIPGAKPKTPGGSGVVVKEKCPDGSNKPANGDCTDPIQKCDGIWDAATSTCTPLTPCPYGDQRLSDGSCPTNIAVKTTCLPDEKLYKGTCYPGLVSCPTGSVDDGNNECVETGPSGSAQSGCSMSRSTNAGVVLPYIMLLIFIHFLSFLFSPPSRGGARGG